MRVYRWFLLQLVVLCALQDFMLHRHWTICWHIAGLLIIVIPWSLFDINKDKMRAELELTYPNVIELMDNKTTFLMYNIEM
ncbi:hypothetical protein PMAYCL1PPCAC_16232 [Pristionchus mayeri]|uniref:Uncharacterized protein n=1 Tax=Pristionchus mayeri TaxID=1317129 RepID=A0AAN5CKD3_9BILA|nr:hypothetical protein PMAYCL1PPCAC_16232 [Pristionchus mayeri]